MNANLLPDIIPLTSTADPLPGAFAASAAGSGNPQVRADWLLDEQSCAALQAWSAQHGASLTAALLSAWQVLLGRLHREHGSGTRVRIGGQDASLAIDLAEVRTPRDILLRTDNWMRQQAVAMRAGAGSIRAAALPAQAVFVWREEDESRSTPTDRCDDSNGDLKFCLLAAKLGNTLSGTLAYAQSCLPRDFADDYAHLWCRLLNLVVARDSMPWDELPLLSKEDTARWVRRWNDTDIGLPDWCFAEYFEEQVRRRPDALAVVSSAARSSYEEINNRSNRLAHILRKHGVGPEVPVAVFLDRGTELVIAVVAVLKAGGIYVPMDPDYPMDRLTYILRDSAAAVVLTVGLLRDRLVTRAAAEACSCICLDAEWEDESLPHDWNPLHSCSVGHTAYIVYTSGSTGVPKGVAVAHRSLSNHLEWTRDALDLTCADRVLQKTPISFVGAIWEILATLVHGATVVVAPPGQHRDPTFLVHLIRTERVTVMQMIPTALSQLVRAPGFQQCTSLRYMICGGEALSCDVAREFRELMPAVRLGNFYGSCEVSDDCAHYEVASVPEDATSVPIGRPITNTRCYILDARLQPVPIGVTGELYVGGAAVARGYLRHPELTASRFVDDPFCPGNRLYRTGDLARHRAVGDMEFMGRADSQVKIRGSRIEPAEVESILRQQEELADAVLLAREDDAGERRLVAYLLPRGQRAPEPRELRARLAARLPEYMLPHAFVTLHEFPRNPNGKLDRSRLPAPGPRDVALAGYEPPQGRIEWSLVSIWSGLLGSDRIGRDDHFFSLGGHSLMAVQLLSRIRQKLQVEIPLTMIFRYPLLSELARQIGAARELARPGPVMIEHDAPVPLSASQQGLWFIAQLQPANTAYHLAMAWQLTGQLNEPALERSLQRLVARHDSLRMRFETPSQGGDARIGIADAGHSGFELSRIDLRGHADLQRARAESMAQCIDTPFNLERGPLLRAELIRTGAEESVLVIALHHLIADGWSLGLLMAELGAAYASPGAGMSEAAPQPSIQYRDYAVWQRGHIRGELLSRQLEYWRAHLTGAPPLLNLPIDRPRTPARTFRGGAVDVSIGGKLLESLRQLSEREGTTLYMTLLAAWSVLLARLCGQSEVVVGTPVANRQHHELEPVIGYFVNTLALRVSLHDDPNVGALMRRVKQIALDGFENQDVPFDLVVEALQPQRSPGCNPIFQTLFALDNTPTEEQLVLAGLGVQELSLPVKASQFDLSLSLCEHGGVVAGRLEYATDLFNQGSVERIASYLQTLLRALLDAGPRPISELRLLTLEQTEQVLGNFNESVRLRENGCLIHEAVARQAAATAHATAVLFEESQLTYAQLNANANRLAHRLRELGIGPDARVAICMDRSLETIVAMLGVLKAGGAYVPVDPDHPAERLSYLLEDSDPALLICHGATRSRIPACELPVIELELLADGTLLSEYPDSNPDATWVAVGPDHLAYVIYTSGTTGRPKGAMNTHGAIGNRLEWMRSTFESGPGDVVLQKTPYSFDISVWEIFWPLSTGARLVIARPGGHRDNAYLLSTVQRQGVTAMHFVPSMLRSFLETPGTTQCDSLRQIFCSGEELPVQTAQRCFSVLPRVALENLYGPTETAVEVTRHSCRPSELGHRIPIGRPIANTRIYILDARRQPVPIGVVGEIYIAGVAVGRGYLNRPDLTQERFVPDLFANEAQQRMYRTGDLGRWLDDGSIEYLGRNDLQVKIRGMRIEVEEIESHLVKIPPVRAAVVIAHEYAPEDIRLVAYLEVEKGIAPSQREIVQYLARFLPDYMIPSAYVTLPALPLSPNGKVDRRALPAPDARREADEIFAAPRGALEERIANTWEKLIRIERVGRDDNFFKLGGHSLLTLHVISELQRAGLTIELTDLFQNPTVASLAARIASRNRSTSGYCAVEIRRGTTDTPLFLIHELTGSLIYAHMLAPHLPDSVPVYGLPPVTLSGGAPTVQSMARGMVDAVLDVVGEGPVRIAGWSFGGTLAYELTSQLLEIGKPVEFLGLIDSYYKSAQDAMPRHITDEKQFLLFMLQMVNAGKEAEQAALATVRAMAAHLEFAPLVEECRHRGVLPFRIAELPPGEILQVLGRVRAMFAIEDAYVAEPSDMRLHLFTAQDPNVIDPLRGWEALVPESRIQLVPVAGNHLSLMDAAMIGSLGGEMSRILRGLLPERAPVPLSCREGAAVVGGGR
jgi:amino acid adenylation domain-containing protein